MRVNENVIYSLNSGLDEWQLWEKTAFQILDALSFIFMVIVYDITKEAK